MISGISGGHAQELGTANAFLASSVKMKLILTATWKHSVEKGFAQWERLSPIDWCCLPSCSFLLSVLRAGLAVVVQALRYLLSFVWNLTTTSPCSLK